MRAVVVVAAVALVAASAATAVVRADPGHGGTSLSVNARADVAVPVGGRVPRGAVGAAVPWVSNGHGLIEDGEILADRSFRQNDPSFSLGGTPPWLFPGPGARWVGEGCAPVPSNVSGVAASEAHAGCAVLSHPVNGTAGASSGTGTVMEQFVPRQIIRAGTMLRFSASMIAEWNAQTASAAPPASGATVEVRIDLQSAGLSGATVVSGGALVTVPLAPEGVNRSSGNVTWVEVEATLGPVTATWGPGQLYASISTGATVYPCDVYVDEVRMIQEVPGVSTSTTAAADGAFFARKRFALSPSLAGALLAPQAWNASGQEPGSTVDPPLGLTALMWPSAEGVPAPAAANLEWEATVGPAAARREQWTGERYETVSLGLGEFLDFCEAPGDGMQPVEVALGVSVARAAAAAGGSGAAAACGDLAEYVAGDAVATTQGALRAAHGRSAPWSSASTFLLGTGADGVSEAYAAAAAAAGAPNRTGLAYAAQAAVCAAELAQRTPTAGGARAALELGFTGEALFGLVDCAFTACEPAGGANAPSGWAYLWNDDVWNGSAVGRFDAAAAGVGRVFAAAEFDCPRGFDPTIRPSPWLFSAAAGCGRWLSLAKDHLASTYLSQAGAAYPPGGAAPRVSAARIGATMMRLNYDLVPDRMGTFETGFAVAEQFIELVRQRADHGFAADVAAPVGGLLSRSVDGGVVSEWSLRPPALGMHLPAALSGLQLISSSIVAVNGILGPPPVAYVNPGMGVMPWNMEYPTGELVVGMRGTTADPQEVVVVFTNRHYSLLDFLITLQIFGLPESWRSAPHIRAVQTSYYNNDTTLSEGVVLNTTMPVYVVPRSTALALTVSLNVSIHSMSVVRFTVDSPPDGSSAPPPPPPPPPTPSTASSGQPSPAPSPPSSSVSAAASANLDASSLLVVVVAAATALLAAATA